MDSMAFVLAGLVVGIIVGLTGVGGGSLMTPLLIFGFGIKPYLAVGTDLLFAAVTKFSGAISLARSRRIDWPIVGWLSLGSIPAALVTLAWLHAADTRSDAVQSVITSALGGALLMTAAATFYKALRGGSSPRHLSDAEHAIAIQPRHWSMPIIFGALIGTMVTLTSVGAGAIGVSALMLLYPRLPLVRIVSADIAYAVPLALVAGLGHAGLGSVDWALLAQLLCGSIPGIWIGSRLIQRTSDRVIRSLLSGLLAWAGLKLISI